MNKDVRSEAKNRSILRGVEWKRVTAVTGALGAGKSELALSLATAAAADGSSVVLADMDIINPYFSLRGLEKEGETRNLSILIPQGGIRWSDTSYINPRIKTVIFSPETRLMIDVGGDEQGALALKQIAAEMSGVGYDLIYVINPYRTYSKSLSEVECLKDRLETASGLNVTAIVANAHYMHKTAPKDCADGIIKVREYSEKLGIPMLFGMAERSVADEVAVLLPEDVELWVFRREILLPWESDRVRI